MGPTARFRALNEVLALVFALIGCRQEPASISDCAALPPAEREACHYGFIAPLVGDPAALDAALDTIEDPASRDLLLLRLAIADPPQAAGLCKRVVTEGAKARCAQVLGRPHLQSTRRPPSPPPEAAP